ncbi:hypothetical protein OPV22_012759 [Ensete ventricosum]|uniref:Jacalin-type lectin domain-containing protein n=1 Tax=Ensete ventricosum TaxID=4639 RepID=A0AAV8R5U5_ENSVE|nr:hypothetical protein OPV22_012759 [Ensete ventricosum]
MGAAYRITNIKIRAGDNIDAIEITFTRYGLTETKHFGGKLYEIPLQEDYYGPFGTNGGNAFSVPVAACKIIGFFGRAGTMIDAIGVYLAPN